MPFDRIVVAIDGSDASFHAFDKALELAGLTRAQVLVLVVEGPLPAYAATIGEIDEVRREKDQFFGSLTAQIQRQAEAAGVDAQIELRPGHAAESIVRYASEVEADLIVLGYKGRFIRDHVLGSTADRVAESAECPVMIVR
jgi:nucleotide-binding universal stress UspA family protein